MTLFPSILFSLILAVSCWLSLRLAWRMDRMNASHNRLINHINGLTSAVDGMTEIVHEIDTLKEIKAEMKAERQVV
jgi:hypothetical protein